MDVFIKTSDEKKIEIKTTIHKKELEIINNHINNHKNVFICGDSGTGKTYLLNMIFNEKNSIKIEPDDIKHDILQRISKHSEKNIIFEDYSNDMMSIKRLIEKISDGEKLTKGSFVITSSQMCLYPNFETVVIKPKQPETMIEIIENKKDIDRLISLAKKSNGNLRNFIHYIENSDNKDVFKDSKEFIKDLLCTPDNTILDSVSEHGHIADVFQENFISSKNSNIHTCCDSFSITDIFDTAIYRGAWELMPYYLINAVNIPKYNMGQLLDKEKIRPGKSWTKYGNYKMRKHRIEEILNDSHKKISVDELTLLRKHGEMGNIDTLLHYNITPPKFDVINHLAFFSKLKQKDVTKIKKNIKAQIEKTK